MTHIVQFCMLIVVCRQNKNETYTSNVLAATQNGHMNVTQMGIYTFFNESPKQQNIIGL